MKLSQLKQYNRIYIQCHDNPDADAIASGYALYRYFKEPGRQVRLFYGGPYVIRKSNLLRMVDLLKIPVEYLPEITSVEEDALLICVDCRYGGGNVSPVTAEHVAVIDHHRYHGDPDSMWEIRSDYGSCSTLVWEFLQEEHFPFERETAVSTALYYGLYMDTAQLGDLYNEQDKRMRQELVIDREAFNRFVHSNITREELKTIARALLDDRYLEQERCSIVRVSECDPNILGLIADFILQTDEIELCVVYSELPDGYKLSIRSEVAKISARKLADAITGEFGSSGGQEEKAGGHMSRALFESSTSQGKIEEYLVARVREFCGAH